MSISHLLEDFRPYTRGKPVSLTDISLEEQRLEAFEKGYQAGWDDCAKAAADDSRCVSADFAQNLRDLSFTYQEAYSAALNGLKPLLDQMIETLLPALAGQALGQQIVQEVVKLAQQQGPQTVEVVTAPDNVLTLETILAEDLAMPVKVTEEATLGEGQVFLRFGTQEREIDLSGVLHGIQRKVAGFYEENQKETA